MNPSLARPGRRLLAALGAVSAAVALVAAGPAAPDVTPPLLTLNPITVANGTAALAGTVGGTPDAGLQLSANGQPLAVDGSGHFAGVVNLNGAGALDLALASPATGGTTAYHIPLSGLGPLGGVVPGNVLAALQQAGVSLAKPVGGFKVVDGLPLTVGGHVANRDQLAGLSVNGTDVLKTLRPDGSFSAQLPGTTREVTLTATDRQGNSERSTYRVLSTSSVVSTPFGPSVSASGAVGLKIASVRYSTRAVVRTKRIRVVVTVKDRLNRLVRGASVTIRATKARWLVGRAKAKRTSRVGRASFVLRVRPAALGRRIALLAAARTPSASAMKTTSLHLPRAARRARHR